MGFNDIHGTSQTADLRALRGLPDPGAASRRKRPAQTSMHRLRAPGPSEVRQLPLAFIARGKAPGVRPPQLERPSGRDVRTYGLWRSAPSTRDGPLSNARVAMGRFSKRAASVGGLCHVQLPALAPFLNNEPWHGVCRHTCTGILHYLLGAGNAAARNRFKRAAFLFLM
jgi:hypothetical protein